MKLHTLIILLPFIVLYQDAVAQEKTVQQMMNDAKKQMADVTDMDPEVKKQIMDMLNSSDMEKAMSDPDAMMGHTTELTSIPAPDKKRLATIPSGVFTKEQLHSFVQNISSKITAQLDPGDRQSVQAIIKKAGGNSKYLSTEAVVAWYNGSPKKALSLASHAASLPENNNALNNLGAMLNICGYEEKAVPLLQYALKADGKNSDVLNNLGRAYLGLGDKKKAEEYYLGCVAIASSHPEANNALGCLYEEAGDSKKATGHFEKSLEGGYNENAGKKLDKISPGYEMVFHIAAHHKPPETFDQFKFKIPEECSGTRDYNRAKAAHKAFQKSIEDLRRQYGIIAAAMDKQGEHELQDMQKRIMAGIKNREIPVFGLAPFTTLAGRMTLKLRLYYTEQLGKFKKDYDRDIRELNKKYGQALEKAREEVEKGNVYGTRGEFTGCLNCEDFDERLCAALGKVSNLFQADAASLHGHFVDKYRLALTGYCDRLIYWNYLTGTPKPVQNAEFYRIIVDFLDEIEDLSKSTPLWASPGKCEDNTPFDAWEKKYKADVKPECPINISFPFIVGKLTLDCTSFSISGGEGGTAGYKKNFVTGQSTLSIGAGLTLEVGGAGVSAGVSASENIYVTFDKNGNPTDVGMKFDAGGKLKMGNISTGAGAGYTVGMNSGWNFTANAAGQTVKL